MESEMPCFNCGHGPEMHDDTPEEDVNLGCTYIEEWSYGTATHNAGWTYCICEQYSYHDPEWYINQFWEEFNS